MKLATFKTSKNTSVSINPQWVMYITSSSHDQCSIVIRSGQIFHIKDTAAQVTAQLNHAINSQED